VASQRTRPNEAITDRACPGFVTATPVRWSRPGFDGARGDQSD
jgi:hypothetical protein